MFKVNVWSLFKHRDASRGHHCCIPTKLCIHVHIYIYIFICPYTYDLYIYIHTRTHIYWPESTYSSGHAQRSKRRSARTPVRWDRSYAWLPSRKVSLPRVIGMVPATIASMSSWLAKSWFCGGASFGTACPRQTSRSDFVAFWQV